LAPVVELPKDFEVIAKHWWICHQNRDKVFRDLRGLLKLESLWFAAYIKLKRNKGSKTPGPDSVSIDSLTKKRILEIRELVLHRNYEWIGVKQVNIPKPGKPGQTRPLGIPAINDRLVQEVIRSIIEPIFELNFSNQSHGFRPNRSCHTALKWINTNMKDSVWFVEGDIKSYFPTINHNKLIEIIEGKIKDPLVLKLIRDGLKAKVFTQDNQEYIPELGTPQGGILSPLLSNIYLDSFDKFMEGLCAEYKGTRTSKYRKRNPAAMKLLKAGKKKEYYRLNIPLIDPADPTNINCKYIRYADDFIIGILGSRKIAEEIRDKIAKWLSGELKIELSMEKTHITHISKGIPFLGYKFCRRTIIIKQRYGNKIVNRKMKIPILDVDMNRVIHRLSAAKFCDKGGNPIPSFKFLQFPQSETNNRINYVLRGLGEWWSIAGNRKRAIARTMYILRASIAKMYAAKFKMKTMAAVFKVGGEDLSKPLGTRAKSIIGVSDKGEKPTKTLKGLLYTKYHTIPDHKGNKLKPSWRPEYLAILENLDTYKDLISFLWIEEGTKTRNPMTQLAMRIRNTLSAQGTPCVICGSTEEVQMHHTKSVKSVKFKDKLEQHIRTINIKQIPLCKVHHLAAHGGNWKQNPIKMSNSKMKNK
jgi:group II intron reverse transcriptase/maturase